jgi:hypothetical protein
MNDSSSQATFSLVGLARVLKENALVVPPNQRNYAWEAAFAGFTIAPKVARTYQPTPKAELLTPWYLDPQSGGPNPPDEERKPGIQYEG